MSADASNTADQPRGRNWLIVILAVVVLCCLCAVCATLGSYLYFYGDRIFRLGALLAGAVV
jgi:hypothetical protein